MKKSKIFGWLISIVVIVAILLAVIVNVENRLKKLVIRYIEQDEMLAANDINIRFFTCLPNVGIELEGATVYLKKDKRVWLTSPSIIAKIDLFEIITDHSNWINSVNKLESIDNKLFINKGENFKLYSNYSFVIEKDKDKFKLSSKLKNIKLNGDTLNFPGIDFNAPLDFDLSKREFKIENAVLNVNDVQFDIKSDISNGKYLASINRENADSLFSKLILPNIFFDEISDSKGVVKLHSKYENKSSSFNYAINNSFFKIGNNKVDFDLDFKLNKIKENKINLNFDIKNISNNEIKHLRFFENFSSTSKYFKGKFDVETHANFKLNNSLRLIKTSLNAKGKFSSDKCIIYNTHIQKDMERKFGNQYSSLNILDLDAKYKFVNGNLNLNHCHFYVDKMKWFIKGTISHKQKLDLILTVRIPFGNIKFSESSQALVDFAIASGLIKKSKIVEIDIKIKGSMKKPKVEVDVSKLLSKYVGIKSKKSRKGIEKNINSFLNNLFK
jgi:hypothetical protein